MVFIIISRQDGYHSSPLSLLHLFLYARCLEVPKVRVCAVPSATSTPEEAKGSLGVVTEEGQAQPSDRESKALHRSRTEFSLVPQWLGRGGSAFGAHHPISRNSALIPSFHTKRAPTQGPKEGWADHAPAVKTTAQSHRQPGSQDPQHP